MNITPIATASTTERELAPLLAIDAATAVRSWEPLVTCCTHRCESLEVGMTLLSDYVGYWVVRYVGRSDQDLAVFAREEQALAWAEVFRANLESWVPAGASWFAHPVALVSA